MAKIVLFDGTNLDGFTKRDGSPAEWKIEDGTMTVTQGDIISRQQFGDAHLHVEWMEPDMPWASGQEKGNSGVYIQGCYELQVLDSYGIAEPSCSDCGGIYNIQSPRVNACKPPLEWQTYDIIFRAPRFDADGKLTEFPRITVMHNGLPVHNNLVMERMTGAPLTEEMVAEGPLLLQDHGNAVSFRNVWICKLPPKGADKY